MPSLTERRKATQRRALAKQKKRIGLRNRINGAIARARVRIGRRRKLIDAASANPGEKAVRYLEGYVGKTENNNSAPFLKAWWAKLSMAWMDHQPWCGGACVAAWELGANHPVPHDSVSTIAIANRAARGDGFTRVPFEQTQAGDFVVMHFGSGQPKHVGLARGPMKGNVFHNVEGNTSSSNSGSQSDGGGVFPRSRPRGLVHTVARPK